MDRTIVIGDIHGDCQHLAKLLGKLPALDAWVNLTTRQLDTLQTTVAGVVSSLEIRLADPEPKSAADITAFLTLHDFAARWFDDLARARQRQTVYADVVTHWRAAYEGLRRGAVATDRKERDEALAAAKSKSVAVAGDAEAIAYIGIQ